MAPSPTESTEAILLCPSCRSQLKVDRQVWLVEEKCPVCSSRVKLTLFPRLFRSFAREEQNIPAGEGEATCSFFPELRAEQECEECGAFLSGRAAIRWEERTLCLPCLHRLREIDKPPAFLARTSLPDKQALALVTLLAPFSLFTAPFALFLLLRHRGVQAGFAPRGKSIWWIALLLSVGWIAAWLTIIVVWVSLIADDFR